MHISTQPTRGNIAKVLGLLQATAPAFEDFGKHNHVAQPLADGKRSLTQELAHLIHCEARVSEAICLALIADQPLLLEVHPERQWGRLLRFDLLEFGDLLPYFRLRRVVLLGVLGKLSNQDWSKTVREASKKRQESVFWKARALALHEHHHLNLIQMRLVT